MKTHITSTLLHPLTYFISHTLSHTHTPPPSLHSDFVRCPNPSCTFIFERVMDSQLSEKEREERERERVTDDSGKPVVGDALAHYHNYRFVWMWVWVGVYVSVFLFLISSISHLPLSLSLSSPLLSSLFFFSFSSSLPGSDV